jgi:hypothetical protein
MKARSLLLPGFRFWGGGFRSRDALEGGLDRGFRLLVGLGVIQVSNVGSGSEPDYQDDGGGLRPLNRGFEVGFEVFHFWCYLFIFTHC